MSLTAGTITRLINRDVPRPPLKFGVRHEGNTSGTTLTRLEDAVSLTVDTTSSPYVSGFDAYYPWAGIRRCSLHEINGDIIAFEDDTYDEELCTAIRSTIYSDSANQCMVQIPKFWVKFVHDATYDYYYISPYPFKDYRLHPAFMRNGHMVDNIYVGAFEAYYTGQRLYSLANKAVEVSKTRATFQAEATGWNYYGVREGGYGWGLMDYYTWSAIQLLYLVEYASLDSQTPSGSTAIGGLGEGLVHAGATQTTGYTGSVGTNLGSDSGVVNIAGDDYAMSYRGIENLWGNTWTVLDGAQTKATGGGTILISPLDAAFNAAGTGYQPTAQVLPDTSSYMHYDYNRSAFSEACQFQPWYSAGGSSSTYFCDYFIAPANYTAVYALRVGGCYNISTAEYAGIFCLDASLAYGSNDAQTSTRLQYVPFDYLGYNRY